MKHIAVGFGCDNACVFCAQGSLRTTAPPPDVEASIAAIEAGDAVAFVGGEPCLHEELADWIRAAVARGAARVVVQTNGRQLVERVAALVEASRGRLSLDVSLHGSTAAMHDYHTQVEGSFVETTRGLEAAKREDVRFGVTVVVTRSNFRHLVAVAALAARLGAKAIHFAGVEPFGAAAASEARLVAAAELVTPHLAAAAKEARRAGLGVVAAAVAEPASSRDLFAGIGEVEPVTKSELGRARLPLLGRPEPGRHEQRGSAKQSGEALRAIFPELFPEPDPHSRSGEAGSADLRAGRG
jgi:MoaA/NifB/PqqE/SkfB family radical SAM enzyme